LLRVTRLAHVGFRTPDPAALENYFTDVLGLWACRRDEDGVVHLTAGGPGAFIELIPAPAAGLDHVALELSYDAEIALAVEQLTADGVRSDPWPRNDPGAAASIEIRDPEDNRIQLIVPDGSFVEPIASGPGIRPIKLGHVATRVTDVVAVQRFYEEQLGFRWSDSIGEDFVFLRCSADHHAVNFLHAERPGELHHIAFELSDFLHTQRACDRLSEAGIPLLWGPGRHGPGHNLFTYHHDPEDRVIELFAGIDRMSDEGQGYFDPRPWHTHSPQRPAVWNPEDMAQANGWGIGPPDIFMV
jgi:catechol 2,3-dioxygenase-like lactoylglutathione lyase family enzyme